MVWSLELGEVLEYLHARAAQVTQDALTYAEMVLGLAFDSEVVNRLLLQYADAEPETWREKYGEVMGAEIEDIMRRQREFLERRKNA